MPALRDAAQLSDMDLFRGLSPAELERLNGLLHRSRFPAGQYIMSAEQPGEVVYVLHEGTVKVLLAQDDGHEVILAFLGPGDTVGEMSLLDSAGRSASVVTLEPVSALWMDRIAFLDCMRSMALFNYNLLRLMARRLRVANAGIRALATLDVTGRVAHQLGVFADQYGEETADGVQIPLRITQGDLADLVGASRERVNRTMVTMRKRGILQVSSRHRITILDRKALDLHAR